MRILHMLFGAALVCAGALFTALVSASTPQDRPFEPVQMGEQTAPAADLDALALKVLNSLRGQTFIEIYDLLLPYRQTSEALAREEENFRLDSGDLSWEDIRAGIDGKRGTDPMGKLKLSSVKDYRALDLRQWFALQCGCWRVYRSEDVEDRMKASWYAVDRHTGLRASKKDAYGHLQPSGTLMFRNRFGDNLRVVCISMGNRWYVEDFTFQVGRMRGGSVPVDSAEVADPRVTNARNTLKIIFDKLRAAYQAGKDSLPPTLTFETIGIKPGELDTKYYDYGIKLDGNKSDGFKGARITATPKKGLKLPGVTLTVDSLKNQNGYAIRDDE